MASFSFQKNKNKKKFYLSSLKTLTQTQISLSFIFIFLHCYEWKGLKINTFIVVRIDFKEAIGSECWLNCKQEKSDISFFHP